MFDRGSTFYRMRQRRARSFSPILGIPYRQPRLRLKSHRRRGVLIWGSGPRTSRGSEESFFLSPGVLARPRCGDEPPGVQGAGSVWGARPVLREGLSGNHVLELQGGRRSDFLARLRVSARFPGENKWSGVQGAGSREEARPVVREGLSGNQALTVQGPQATPSCSPSRMGDQG